MRRIFRDAQELVEKAIGTARIGFRFPRGLKPAAEKAELDVRAEARTLQRPGHPGLFQQAPGAVWEFVWSTLTVCGVAFS